MIGPPYAWVALPGLGWCWARAVPTDEGYREWVEASPYAVEILGVGWADSEWRWSDTPAEAHEALLAALESVKRA